MGQSIGHSVSWSINKSTSQSINPKWLCQWVSSSVYQSINQKKLIDRIRAITRIRRLITDTQMNTSRLVMTPIQTGELGQTHTRTDRQVDGRYQVHYLRAPRSIIKRRSTASARLSAYVPGLQTHRQNPRTGNDNPLLQIEGNCLLLHSASRAPNFDRYAQEIDLDPDLDPRPLTPTLNRVSSRIPESNSMIFPWFLQKYFCFSRIQVPNKYE